MLQYLCIGMVCLVALGEGLYKGVFEKHNLRKLLSDETRLFTSPGVQVCSPGQFVGKQATIKCWFVGALCVNK